jgi:DNA-binding NarL/FixJ family response regulator
MMIGLISTNIYEAESAETGLRETMRMRPDLVLCDIHMPYEDGFVYVHNIRNSGIVTVAETHIVMLTSDATEEAVLMAKQLRVEGYLVKPVSINAVKKSMERTLKVELP